MFSECHKSDIDTTELYFQLFQTKITPRTLSTNNQRSLQFHINKTECSRTVRELFITKFSSHFKRDSTKLVVTRDGRLDRGRASHTRFYRNDRICPFQQLPSQIFLSENLTCIRFKKCIVLIFLLLFLISLRKEELRSFLKSNQGKKKLVKSRGQLV